MFACIHKANILMLLTTKHSTTVCTSELTQKRGKYILLYETFHYPEGLPDVSMNALHGYC